MARSQIEDTAVVLHGSLWPDVLPTLVGLVGFGGMVLGLLMIPGQATFVLIMAPMLAVQVFSLLSVLSARQPFRLDQAGITAGAGARQVSVAWADVTRLHGTRTWTGRRAVTAELRPGFRTAPPQRRLRGTLARSRLGGWTGRVEPVDVLTAVRGFAPPHVQVEYGPTLAAAPGRAATAIGAQVCISALLFVLMPTIALALRGPNGLRSTKAAPAAIPIQACALLPAGTLDRLVPGADPPTAEINEQSGYNEATCEADRFLADSSPIQLQLAVTRFGSTAEGRSAEHEADRRYRGDRSTSATIDGRTMLDLDGLPSPTTGFVQSDVADGSAVARTCVRERTDVVCVRYRGPVDDTTARRASIVLALAALDRLDG